MLGDRERRRKSVGLTVRTLNVGTKTGEGKELTDIMLTRKANDLWVQDTRLRSRKT